MKLSSSVLAVLFFLTFFSCRSAPEIELAVPPGIVDIDGDEDFDTLYPEELLADDPFQQDIAEETFDSVVDEEEPAYEQLDELEALDDEGLEPPADYLDALEPEVFPELPLPLEAELPLEEDFPLEYELPVEDELSLEDQPALEPLPPEPLPVPQEEPPPIVAPPAQPLPVPAPPPPPVTVPPAQPQPAPPPATVAPEQPQLTPPPPPPFLRPAEPEPAPQVFQQAPAPLTPIPELPGRAEPSGEEIVFSRTVRATVGQIVEIPFWGIGWVYLGELGNRRGMNYSSRRLDIEAGLTIGQTFVFIAEAAGTYILRFFRQDFIQDYLLNDYVQVIVGERREDTVGAGIPVRDRVIAEPRWPAERGPAARPGDDGITETPLPAVTPATGDITPLTTPPAPLAPAASEVAPLVTPPAPPRIESPAEFVSRARQEFDAGRIEQALSILDNMMQYYPSGTDEALWLKGQLLEANSPARDIRQSLEYYRRLVTEFPQSIRVPDARRRIAYLERFFFNIR
jgi:hypothetical protein